MERPAKRNGLVRSGADPAVTLAIIKQSDARMADLQESIAALITDLEKEHPDIRFELTRDQTQLLSYSIHNLNSNLLVGAVLAALIIFLFMKDLRSGIDRDYDSFIAGDYIARFSCAGYVAEYHIAFGTDSRDGYDCGQFDYRDR